MKWNEEKTNSIFPIFTAVEEPSSLGSTVEVEILILVEAISQIQLPEESATPASQD